MEKSGNKSSVLVAKRNLENSLGDDWQKYLSHLRKFFRNGSKLEVTFYKFLFRMNSFNFCIFPFSSIVKSEVF